MGMIIERSYKASEGYCIELYQNNKYVITLDYARWTREWKHPPIYTMGGECHQPNVTKGLFTVAENEETRRITDLEGLEIRVTNQQDKTLVIRKMELSGWMWEMADLASAYSYEYEAKEVAQWE